MKKFLEIILGSLAKLTLWLYKPKIIGITGSVGKSSTKEAVVTVLSTKFHAWASPGNLNSQLGLPLAVLGFTKPGGFKKNISSFFDWLGILLLAFFKVFNFNYPKILILEMGTDRPGDIAYLLRLSGPLDAAVITDIGISHLEFFKNPEDLAKEKLSLLKGLRKEGAAVLNFDNDKIREGAKLRSTIYSYGLGSDADIKATDIQIVQKGDITGLNFKVHYNGTVVPFFIPNALGKPAVYSALAAAGVGMVFGMNLVSVSEALSKYTPPAGRLRLIAGVNDSMIIDDTYNAAPSSTIAALEALSNFAKGRKLAALGHLAELGKMSEEGHRQVGRAVIKNNIDKVFLVGDLTNYIKDELEKNKYKGSVEWFENSERAAGPIRSNLKAGDTLLVKGSQSARMEKVVRFVMKSPSQASKLLVRQSGQWLKT